MFPTNARKETEISEEQKDGKQVKKCVGLLAKQIEEHPMRRPFNYNPFHRYSGFERPWWLAPGEEVKLLIFLPFQVDVDWKNSPLEVSVWIEAKVADTIGLICWRYSEEARQPNLDEDVAKYCLYIADRKGDYHPELGSLDLDQPISRFRFRNLVMHFNEPDVSLKKDASDSPPANSFESIRIKWKTIFS